MDNKEEQKVVKVENLTIGYVARYSDHYCVVSISPFQIMVKDEDDEIVTQMQASEGKAFDIPTNMEMISYFVIAHIQKKYLSQKGENENG